jgi:hypothetical protein
MLAELSQYLDNIRHFSKLGRSEEQEIITELEAHFEDRLQELQDSGTPEAEAVNDCLGCMGSAELVAKQIYEAYSQGSWKQVLMASAPHLLFGALFMLNWWQHIGWLSALLLLVIGTTAYGWWHDKPTWVFSWLGYTLLPVLAVGLLLLYLPKGWSLLAIPVYLLLAAWWLFHIMVQTVRRDWLFTSLMMLPLPIIIGWALAIAPGGKISHYSLQRVYDMAPWIGTSFMALALTIAAFIRVRQRWLRIGLLAVSGLLTLTLVVYYTAGKLYTLNFVGLVLVMWGVFLVPPLLERGLRSGRLRFRKSGAPSA